MANHILSFFPSFVKRDTNVYNHTLKESKNLIEILSCRYPRLHYIYIHVCIHGTFTILKISWYKTRKQNWHIRIYYDKVIILNFLWTRQPRLNTELITLEIRSRAWLTNWIRYRTCAVSLLYGQPRYEYRIHLSVSAQWNQQLSYKQIELLNGKTWHILIS